MRRKNTRDGKSMIKKTSILVFLVLLVFQPLKLIQQIILVCESTFNRLKSGYLLELQ